MFSKGNNKGREISWERVLLILIFLSFLLQTLFFIFYLSQYFGPDEAYHYNVSIAYSKVFGIPKNSSETFLYGDITRIPFLFYWLSGRFINIANILKIDSFILLRFLSLLYSLVTMFFVWLISKDVIKEKYYRVLPVFMLANTMMFSFLGGVVTYDTLVNLFLVISFWSLLLYLKQDSKCTKYLLIWIATSLLACATKFPALPFVFLGFVVILFFVCKNKIKFWKELSNPKIIFPIIFICFFILINFYIYGINILRYKRVTPVCNQVMQHEECLNNAIYRRSFVYEETGIQSREGKRIRDLLLTDERMNPFDFFFDWEASISPRLYGIFSHSSITFPRNFSFVYTLVFLLLMIPFIRYIKKSDKQIVVAFFLVLGYVLVLAFFQHYYWYLKMNRLNIAMQGRYLLPVIPAAYLIEVWSLTKIRNDRFKKLILIVILLIFLCGNVFIFTKSIIYGGAEWYPNLFNSI
ncbi:MAG: ArnT family glycosyltransferase [Candidatus Dojkabacteria bacterium]|jgi:hypothetical protein